MSAAALAVVWRLGRTRCVCTSTTGPSAAKHSSAAAGSTSASAGMSKNPPPCSASSARSAAAVPTRSRRYSGVVRSRRWRVPVRQVDRAVQRPLLPRPGRHRCVLVGGPGRQQRDVDGAEPTERSLEHRLQPGGEVESLVERGVSVPRPVEVVALEPREDVDVEVPEILVARRLVVLPTPRSSCGSTSRPCSAAVPSTVRPARSPGSARSPCRSCRSGWTTPSSPPSSPRAPRSPRSCTSAAGSPASSAPPSSGATRSAPARAATTASASSTTTSRTGPTPAPPGSRPDAGSAPPCHRLKTLGWNVSEPDADGQCTFTPPTTGPIQDNGDPTLLHELAEATQAALRARRSALARS